jgi:hypothetical protein
MTEKVMCTLFLGFIKDKLKKVVCIHCKTFYININSGSIDTKEINVLIPFPIKLKSFVMHIFDMV